MKSKILLATIASFFVASLLLAAEKPGAVLIPTKYVNGTFFARPVTEKGETLNFYTDTGGALWIRQEAIEENNLGVRRNGDGVVLAAWPKFKPGASIPEPLGGPVNVMGEQENEPVWAREWEGMLGQQWFAGRVWTFDYPKQQLWLREAGDLPKLVASHVVALGFQTGAGGKHAADFPRIEATIDGEKLDFLFDTGAQTFLAQPATSALKLDGSPRATSFITKSVSDKWRQKHPEWRFIDKAEQVTGAAMIEVPRVMVGGYTVGPVWFTVRPDRAFHEYMAKWMDKPTEGALGGNAYQTLRITLDYPNGKAYFEK
jgi:hypothetical protein